MSTKIDLYAMAHNLCRGALARFGHLAGNACRDPKLHEAARACAEWGGGPQAYDLMVAAHAAVVAAHARGDHFAARVAAQATCLAVEVKAAADTGEADPHGAVISLLHTITQANAWAHEHEQHGTWAAWEH